MHLQRLARHRDQTLELKIRQAIVALQEGEVPFDVRPGAHRLLPFSSDLGDSLILPNYERLSDY